jgi:tetratricopeptide (TPR) repeat protein
MDNITGTLGQFLVNDFGDRYLYQVNRNSFNFAGSDSVFHRVLGERPFKEYQLNVIIGTDSGILPRYIEKKGIPTGARYVFVELPEVLEVLQSNDALADLPPEIRVTTVDSFMEVVQESNFSDYVFLNAVAVYGSIGSNEGHLPEYQEIVWSVVSKIEPAKRNLWALSYPADFTLRQLENLTENQVNFKVALHDALQGRTAIVLAGGPSLKAALPWVKENRDRLLIIAVSRISRILQQEGVTPHLVVSVDPQQISFEVSREMLLYADSPDCPIFVHSNHSSPLLGGQWSGKSLYYGPLLPWTTQMNKDELSYPGPTVSNVSLSLAMHLGCTTVLLSGVDLCLAADGRSHAAGSNESNIPDLGRVLPQVETYSGRWADTNPAYTDSLEVLGQQGKLAAEYGCRVYNVASDAAKADGIEHKPLTEVVLPPCDETAAEVLQRLVPETTSASRSTHYRRIKKEIERARYKFQQILDLVNEALTCTDGLFGRNGMQRDFRYKIRMDKIERKLDRSFTAFSVLIKRFALKHFLTILKTPKEAGDWSDEQIENATREYYQAYLAGTEYLIELMDSTLRRIAARMEEEKKAPDLNLLFVQWQKDTQCGRLGMLRRRAPQVVQSMSPVESQVAELIELRFQQAMTQKRTSQISMLETNRDLKHVRSKALVLFKRHALDQLEALIQGLAAHPDQEHATPYGKFVQGLLFECRNEPDQALACYEELLTNPPHHLTEDALIQISRISIAGGKADNVLLAIECLTGISPIYLPPYGEILKLVGRFSDAFHAYNRYLGLVPDDVGAMIRLGALCQEASLFEAAAELFNRALAKDPKNNAARLMLDGLHAEQLPSA